MFKGLEMYQRSGFNQRDADSDHLLSTNISEGVIFVLSKEDKANITRINFRGKDKQTEKAVKMMAYLIDLALDISITPKSNISSSPGFDVIFGDVV